MADQRVEKWSKWIDGPIKNNVLSMHLHRHAWREVAGMLEGRDEELPTSYWWEFMLDTYATTQAVAVRRQVEVNDDAASLARVVVELRDDPARLTREHWLGMWTFEEPHGLDRVLADRAWTEEYGGGEHFDPHIAAADYDELTAAGTPIKGYVDQHVAHSDPRAVGTAVTLKVADLHAAIDVIGEKFRRYYNVFTASSMIDLVPVIQHDWMAVFREPWARPTTDEARHDSAAGPHRESP